MRTSPHARFFGDSTRYPKKEKESTLTIMYGFITHRRRDGNSLRLVDNAIQILYDGKICVVEDHYQMGRDRTINRFLFDLIIKRLYSEHNLSELIDKDMIRIDNNKLEIEFKDPDPRYAEFIATAEHELNHALDLINRVPELFDHSNFTYKEWKEYSEKERKNRFGRYNFFR